MKFSELVGVHSNRMVVVLSQTGYMSLIQKKQFLSSLFLLAIFVEEF